MPRTLTHAIQLLRLDFFCERVRQFAGVQLDHFDSELNRRLRAVILDGGADEETVPALAELDAVAANEAIDEATAKELLLRLRERYLRRRLTDATPEEMLKLQRKLLEIREKGAQLA